MILKHKKVPEKPGIRHATFAMNNLGKSRLQLFGNIQENHAMD
jgi:hypothetical protein